MKIISGTQIVIDVISWRLKTEAKENDQEHFKTYGHEKDNFCSGFHDGNNILC